MAVKRLAHGRRRLREERVHSRLPVGGRKRRIQGVQLAAPLVGGSFSVTVVGDGSEFQLVRRRVQRRSFMRDRSVPSIARASIVGGRRREDGGTYTGHQTGKKIIPVRVRFADEVHVSNDTARTSVRSAFSAIKAKRVHPSC